MKLSVMVSAGALQRERCAARVAFAHPAQPLIDGIAYRRGVTGKARREAHHAVVHAAAVAGADRDGGGVVAVVLVSNERGDKVLAHRDTVLNDVHESLGTARRCRKTRSA